MSANQRDTLRYRVVFLNRQLFTVSCLLIETQLVNRGWFDTLVSRSSSVAILAARIEVEQPELLVTSRKPRRPENSK